MMVTSSRTSMMGSLTSPSSPSPGSHPLNHHHLNHLDDDHHPADLSPRSSNSSLVSSSESLLNTSLSVPSPTAISANQRGQRRSSGGSSGVGGGSDSALRSTNANGSTEEELNALQNLRNAFERSSFTSLFHHDHHNNQSSDNEQMEQHISKSFAILGSPVVPSHHHQLLNSPTNLSRRSGDDSEDESHAMVMAFVGQGSPTGIQTTINGIASVIFQCPLCAVVCSSRHDFNEHLVTHSTEHRACPKCAFIATNEDELREHVQDAHGADDVGMLSEDEEVKTPKTNAQGKLKTFKCKQCEYTAVTKKEFWDHNKTHIRQEKMLHCPKCSFVTEYKHHLEYHLRNHMGSKPYQCTKCNYSCVNKSMLNSHLKSHSNVYQYRCSDCSYATKYCHSLKLHLRKYNHNPAMVLNPDGTPNPLPIIDVYGTRRGPKIKRPDPILEGLATTGPVVTIPGSPKLPKKKSTPHKKDKTDKAQQKLQQQQILDARDLSPIPASSPRYISSMPNQSATPPLKKMKEEHSSGDSDSEMRMSSSHLHHRPGRVTQLPQAPISPSSIALILQQGGGNGEQAQRNMHPPTSPNAIEFYNAALNQYLLNPMLQMQNASLNELLAAHQMANEQKAKVLHHLLQSGIVPNTQQQNVANDLRTKTTSATFGSTGMALDLSGRVGISGNGAEDGKKRKRKGKAQRYERRGSSEEDEDDMRNHYNMEDEALDFSNNNNNTEYKDKNRKRSSIVMKQEVATDLSLSSPPLYQNMMCKYCEISFPDRELYTIHMNYHSGDMDPFKCKSCGKQTRDKVEFFRHLTTDPH